MIIKHIKFVFIMLRVFLTCAIFTTASAFALMRYPVGYNPDLRVRPNYYPTQNTPDIDRTQKWTPPEGYVPRRSKINENIDSVLSTDKSSSENYSYIDDQMDSRKYIVQGIWVGRSIITSHETVSFDSL